MSRGAADLPKDPAELRRFASELQRNLVALEAEIQAKSLLVEKLKFQLAVLRRARFGRSSEKLDAQIEQLELLKNQQEEIKSAIAELEAALGRSD